MKPSRRRTPPGRPRRCPSTARRARPTRPHRGWSGRRTPRWTTRRPRAESTRSGCRLTSTTASQSRICTSSNAVEDHRSARTWRAPSGTEPDSPRARQVTSCPRDTASAATAPPSQEVPPRTSRSKPCAMHRAQHRRDAARQRCSLSAQQPGQDDPEEPAFFSAALRALRSARRRFSSRSSSAARSGVGALPPYDAGTHHEPGGCSSAG
jgi:hypothetical protein